MALILTDENFSEEIKKANKPVLVDFWLEGCGPCQLLVPVLEKIVQEFNDKIILAKVNLHEALLTAQQYGINVAPTVILFKNNQIKGGFVGLQKEEDIRKWLNDILNKED